MGLFVPKLSLCLTIFLCLSAASRSYAGALDEHSQVSVPLAVKQTSFDDLHKEAKAYIIEHVFPELTRWLAFKVADQHRGEIPADKIPKNGSIVDMDINPDGKLVMTYQTGFDQPGELIVWDLKSKELIKKIELDFDPYYVRITPDGNKAIVKKGAGYLQTTLWDLNTAKKIMVLSDCGNKAMSVSPDGSFAVMAVNHYTCNDEIYSWDLVREAKKASFSFADNYCDGITCPSYLSISPDSTKVAFMDLNGIPRIRIIYLIAKKVDVLRQYIDSLSVWGLQFVDARTVAIFVSDFRRTEAKIHVSDINSGDFVKVIKCDPHLVDNIRAADFFGENLTCSYKPNSITVNNFMSGQCLDVHFPDFEGRGMRQYADVVDKVILRHNWLVASMESGRLYVWDLHNKELFEELGKLTWKQVHLLRWIYEYAMQGKKLLLSAHSPASIDAIYALKGMPDFIQSLVSEHVLFEKKGAGREGKKQLS